MLSSSTVRTQNLLLFSSSVTLLKQRNASWEIQSGWASNIITPASILELNSLLSSQNSQFEKKSATLGSHSALHCGNVTSWSPSWQRVISWHLQVLQKLRHRFQREWRCEFLSRNKKDTKEKIVSVSTYVWVLLQRVTWPGYGIGPLYLCGTWQIPVAAKCVCRMSSFACFVSHASLVRRVFLCESFRLFSVCVLPRIHTQQK